MKTLCLICVLFTAVAIRPFANAQDSGEGGSINDLHNAITKTPYVYMKGVYPLSLKFKANGTGDCGDVKFKWHSKDPQTVELSMLALNGQPNGKKTTLTFSSDYATFSGIDFDGITKVTGKLAGAGQ